MAHDKKIVEIAKNLFVIENKDPGDITEIIFKKTGVKISEVAVYRWRKKYHWDKYIQLGGNIGLALELQKQYLVEIHEAIKNKKLTDPKTADSLAKTAKILENLMPKKTLLANIFIFLEDTVDYLTAHVTDEDFLKSFQKYIPELSDHLRKKYTS